jgi:hypothetical protein
VNGVGLLTSHSHSELVGRRTASANAHAWRVRIIKWGTLLFAGKAVCPRPKVAPSTYHLQRIDVARGPLCMCRPGQQEVRLRLDVGVVCVGQSETGQLGGSPELPLVQLKGQDGQLRSVHPHALRVGHYKGLLGAKHTHAHTHTHTHTHTQKNRVYNSSSTQGGQL